MVILFDRFNLPDDVYEVIFATNQQKTVGKLLMHEMRKHGGQLTKSEMSAFATELHDGKVIKDFDDPEFVGKEVKVSYNKRQFYDRILTPMKGMGLIDYDLYKKTYRVSDQFNKALVRVGLMWMKEVRTISQEQD